jgi:RHS repeat-associated protein
MRGNLKSAQIRLLGLLLLFLITASGVFAFHAEKSRLAKLALSIETALKAIDFASKNDISIDSEFSANLRQTINFTGRRYSVFTGQYNNRNRFYSPALGRFVSKDPTGFNGGFNLYRYADNNPVRNTDQYGLLTGVEEYTIFSSFVALTSYLTIDYLQSDSWAKVKQDIGAGYNWTKENIQDAYHGITCQFLPGEAAQRIYLATQEEAADEDAQEEDTPDFVVDEKGNVIPLKPGEKLQGSPDGRWIQIIGPDGKPTGVRIDQGHKPGGAHTDPRSLQPHGHIPGVNNPDGTPWLPIKW